MISQHQNLRGPIIMMFLGGAVILHQLNRLRLSQRLQETGVVPLRSAPQGFVELQGFAWPCRPVMAPLHGKTAVFCHLTVEQQTKNGWQKVCECKIGESFYFVDKTGCALVLPEGAEVDMSKRTQLYKALSVEQKQNLTTALTRNSGFQFGNAFFHQYRITEQTLLAGAPLYIAGNLAASNGVHGQPFPGMDKFLEKVELYSRNPLSRLVGVRGNGVVSSTAQKSEIYFQFASKVTQNFAAPALSMASGDGITTSAHFTQAVTAPADVLAVHGVIASSETQRLFFADCGQGEVLEHLRRRLWLKILGGAAMIAAGFTLLALQLHLF